MLDSNLLSQLTTYLKNLRYDVELIATLDDRKQSADMKQLLEEISGCSKQVSFRLDGNAARRPSFIIARAESPVKVEFAGLPLGHEFTSLVLALLQVGGHPVKADEDTISAIKALPGKHVFETYMSLTCQNCPTVVQALNAMSVLNPNIQHTSIEGSLFPEEIAEKSIMAVPAMYKDGELFGQGRMTLEEILGKIDTGAADRAAAALENLDPFDVLVVGGGPGGSAAAVYAARKGIRTGVVAERPGGQVLDTMAIENFVSVPYTEGPKLGAELEAHVNAHELEYAAGQEAVQLTPAKGEDGLHSVTLASGPVLKAKAVVLATGARWRLMQVPGEEQYRNRGVTFCPHCDGPLFAGKKVAVVGGGNSGIEAAIDLAGVVGQVTVVEFLEELKADQVLVDKLHTLANVNVILSAQITEVRGDGQAVTGVVYTDRSTGESQDLQVEGVFVQIGLLPNTEWLAETIECNERGEIIIDAAGATNIPGIYAAGDCTSVPYKQIVVAMGGGATAALGAFDYLIRQ